MRTIKAFSVVDKSNQVKQSVEFLSNSSTYLVPLNSAEAVLRTQLMACAPQTLVHNVFSRFWLFGYIRICDVTSTMQESGRTSFFASMTGRLVWPSVSILLFSYG